MPITSRSAPTQSDSHAMPLSVISMPVNGCIIALALRDAS